MADEIPSAQLSFQLAPLERADVDHVWRWRLTCREGLRTPIMLTREQQEDWWRRVVQDCKAEHRYWAVVQQDGAGATRQFVGMVGLVNLEPENGLAEISLITDPDMKGRGVGTVAVRLVLDEGFLNLGLSTIWGECYLSNPGAVEFWKKMATTYGALEASLPRRKRWAGVLWDSYCFFFTSGQVVPMLLADRKGATG